MFTSRVSREWPCGCGGRLGKGQGREDGVVEQSDARAHILRHLAHSGLYRERDEVERETRHNSAERQRGLRREAPHGGDYSLLPAPR